ncbi:MAG: hypothetical protein JW730_07105 [Anaerolineales bacterium]|nr:hypothetical protein [Anaerolineales bacterium]
MIAHYVMDGDQPLTADSAGNTTYYLYGLGAIGEKIDAWSYSLPDGTNTPRQLSNNSGSITLAARYTPWGDTLDTYGTGNFTFGYFGGVMDAATGLLYVGDGQYYDPATGRFLTRDAKPNNSNPYVPWDPTGAILGPLAAMALFFGKRKKASKWDLMIILLVLGLSVGLSLSACQFTIGGWKVTATPTSTPTTYHVEITPATDTGSGVSGGGSATPTLTYTCTVTPTATSTPIPTPTTTPTPVVTSTLPPLSDKFVDPYMRAYNTYIALKYHAGWWNNNTIGSMTSLDYLEILLSFEFSGQVMDSVPIDLLKETVVRNFYVRCPAWAGHPCSPDSDADILIYIARKKLLDARPGYILQAEDDPKNNGNWKNEKPDRSHNDYSEIIRSPSQPKWMHPYFDQAIEWGNISMIMATLQAKAMSVPEGLGTDEVVLRRGAEKTMFILTDCQNNHWSAPPNGQNYDYGVRNCREPKNWIKKPKE